MQNSSMPTLSRRVPFLIGITPFPKLLPALGYTPRLPLLPLPHPRMQTPPSHPNHILSPLILVPLPLWWRQLLRLLALLWVAVHRRRRRWWNILEHHATHVLVLILPPLPHLFRMTCIHQRVRITYMTC